MITKKNNSLPAKVAIAVDAMGGDHGAKVPLLASLRALTTFPNLEILIVGNEELLKKFLSKVRYKRHTDRLHIVHAPETVTMEDSPSIALRTKKNSSMRIAVNLIKEGKAQACVSAGNTGALMAISHFVLRPLPSIDRAAIISALPTFHGKCRVLDLGANVDSSAENLLQFALMGSILTSAVDGIASPTIGLLNVGVEEIKGNDQVKRTAQLMSQCKFLNYKGYVEGDDIFKGTVDVVVCDGFVGNIALKSSEGLARLLHFFMKEAFNKNIYNKIMSLFLIPALKAFKRKTDPARYNGATFLGLQGIVVKSHGSADESAFENAIHEAVGAVKHDIPSLIRYQMEKLLGEGPKE